MLECLFRIRTATGELIWFVPYTKAVLILWLLLPRHMSIREKSVEVPSAALNKVELVIKDEGPVHIQVGYDCWRGRIANQIIFESIAAELGPVFALVNVAGLVDQQPFEEISAERLDQIMRVNVSGTVFCSQGALKSMKALGDGRIINFSSKSGKTGSALMAAYSAAKGAIIGFGDVHTRAHLYRSILEGLAYALRDGKERTERRSRIPITELRVAGGGSQSDAALQLSLIHI